MKRLYIVGFLVFFIQLNSFSQNNDLIVTTNGDSIACEILEANDSEIIFKMKYNGHKNVQTTIDREDIVEFKYDVIQKDMYIFKPGTSYIAGKAYPISHKSYSLEYLQNASNEELEYYFYKAKKLQKDGKTVTIVGAVTLGADVLLLSVLLITDSYIGMGGAALMMLTGFAAIGTLAVGIPMRITGKKRVERINTIKNTAYDGIKIDLKPCAQYNLATQNYQPGVTLRIRF